MTLVSWSPLREFDDIFNRYNRLSRRMPVPSVDAEGTEWRPVANISETPKEYLVKAELPEVSKDDIQVKVNDGVITISGERRMETKSEDEQVHRIESFYGSFARSFNLPADVDEAAISAESKDGVLTVHLPKTEVVEPQAIDIKVA
ncbi:MAG: Hsp20/alpha crystallin family protein [Gammaproteobacteria bacterium]|nr:Hsp20/alpha crystallin family protein [Gammaproteobacteria bacterium]MBT8444485.1 Hsp20/alpha crystallin family protein [Gammaproteobacteria bacterium]NND35965.1 Hsp20/alpha crystallin family protein [Gammaproteobacteria bacterium]